MLGYWNAGTLMVWVIGILEQWNFGFIKFVSKNPFLWTGMKGASAESRK